MFIDLTPAQRALRDELRGYFAVLMTPAERAELLTERHGAVYRDVVRRMGRDGWLGVGWPARYGGRGFGQVEQQIFADEAARADVPLPAVTLQTVGPTLQEHGTPWQQDFFLPRILAGEVHFAIGYTEPEAGTDLASLRTRAVRDGEEYVVDGQKIFTTGAHAAGYVWLACRTDPAAPKHKGISILIVDTTDPGFSWTPIITHDGAHHVNATYYAGVRVPVRMRVGAENEGWRLITTQLNHERVMLGPAGRIAALHDRVHAWAAERSLLAQPDVHRALARASVVMRVNELLNWQVAAAPALDVADASATKVFSSEQLQVIGQELAAGGGPARRRQPGYRGADDLAGRPAQAQHRADLRRRRERDPARADRHRRPRPAPGAPMSAEDTIRAAAARLTASGDSRPRAARDPVNLPMIRNWIEVIDPNGRDDPGTAPPAMIQVWTMPGLHGVRADDDPLGQMSQLLDEAGYTSVVATNCDQAYHRYLKTGEQLSVRARLLDVTGPKRTALGEGWFVTTRSTWFSAGEPVATMDFRILKFRPAQEPPTHANPASTTSPMLPLVTPDTAFFWDGTAAGELRIQRCAKCGVLRHPPGPMCPACGEASTAGVAGGEGYTVAAGTGEVFSYVVHHHPPVPGKRLPMVVALVQLPEGVRILGEMPGVRPDQVRIGLPVRVTFTRPGERRHEPALLGSRRGGAAGPGDRRDAHVRDRLGPGHPGLPGRAPRPGPRRRPRGQGHLRQHPDHDRAGPAVRLGLGPGRGGPRRLHPARRALPRGRDAHPQRAGHRG